MARRRCRKRGGLLPNPIPPPFTVAKHRWRNPYRFGRGVKIENLKNYHLGYKYSPRYKQWLPGKKGKGITFWDLIRGPPQDHWYQRI